MDKSKPRSIRLTTRRLMLGVAASALMLALMGRPAAHRPGLYLRVAGHGIGICRDDPSGRESLPGGHPGGWAYQLGVWRSDSGGRLVHGFRWRDGRVESAFGAYSKVIW